MNEIRLKNFRCFREEQRVRLAPLTLLVGENSTGKTSFMALIRALIDAASFRDPDFKEPPYDLGSFDEIAHHRGTRRGRAATFEAGFDSTLASAGRPLHLEVIFEESKTAPAISRRLITDGETWLEEQFKAGSLDMVRFGTPRGNWEAQISPEEGDYLHSIEEVMQSPPISTIIGQMLAYQSSLVDDGDDRMEFTSLPGSPSLTPEDQKLLIVFMSSCLGLVRRRPFASAPVRSKPSRTYDPSRLAPDQEGDYIPMYLASVHSQYKEIWVIFKDWFKHFGKESGLFDEISIRKFGRHDSDPFQVRVRDSPKSPWRNLIDVGYGVSQVLPVITELLRTELLREDEPGMFLLQQPELHLHPNAQAALGSLFCEVAGPDRQLVIETHSDHLMNRVRMDIRDGESELSPDDVSILYFEREGLDVNIHSLRIDEAGNVLGAPDSYGRFFMQETARSLGL